MNVMNMDVENVKALADIVKTYGLTSLEIKQADVKIRIEKEKQPPAPVVMAPAAAHHSIATPLSTPPAHSGSAPSLPETGAPAVAELEVDFSHLTEVKSPLVGVFYSSPSPDLEPFVSIGKRVKKGDVLCIIETMKLMNEINAEQDGEIVDICVKNGDIVEFGQTIFKLN